MTAVTLLVTILNLHELLSFEQKFILLQSSLYVTVHRMYVHSSTFSMSVPSAEIFLSIALLVIVFVFSIVVVHIALMLSLFVYLIYTSL